MPPSDANDRQRRRRSKSIYRPSPGRARPDTITPDERRRVSKINAIDALVDEAIAGRKPAGQLARELQVLRLTPSQKRYAESESRRKSRIAERQAAEELHKLPAAFGFGELSKPLLGLGSPDPLWGALEALSVAPIGRGINLGARGVRAVRPAREIPEHAPRVVRYGEREQQFPKSRSRLTQPVVRGADILSEALTDILPQGTSALARATRATAGKASSRARVPKQAGRLRRQEAVRTRAQMADEINELRPGVRGRLGLDKGSEVAHWWWAQIPARLRNVEGLKLVRGKQAEELTYRESGKALADLQKAEKRLNAELASLRAGVKVEGTAVRVVEEADPQKRVFEILGALQDVKLLKSDLPAQVEDIRLSLAQLDQLIAHPPAYKPQKIEAARTLMGDRKRILIASNVLKPERAAEREGLVSRWLGLEPSGEEVFLGHRMKKVRGSRPTLLPGGVSTGRTRLPEGVSATNKLVLAKTGRVRQSFEAAIEDWEAVQVFESGNVAKEELASMGAPLQGTRIAPDEVLINPKGRPVPKHWSRDVAAQKAEEGFDVEELIEAARQHTSSYLAETSDEVARMLDEAAEAGVSWDELRVVKRDVAERYFAQFLPAKTGTMAGRAYDSAVNASYLSVVYARLGYIPKNIVQNVIMAVPHQGAFFPANLVRTAQVFSDRKLRRLIRAEVSGSGATRAAAGAARGPIKPVTEKVADVMSFVGDDPLRSSAFLHEAAAAGVISRAKPWLNAGDKRRLIEFLTDAKHRPLLNDVRARAVEAMADFDRMTPSQRLWARRFSFIPGWLMAGTRYPFHFAANRPMRSAVLAYIAMGEPGAPDELQVNEPITHYFAEGMPSWLEGIPVLGKHLRTRGISPVSTPWELILAATGRGTETAGGFVNPVGEALYNIGRKQTTYASSGAFPVDSYREAAKQNLEGLAPNLGFARDLISPSGEGIYPEDATRAGRLRREVGVLPIEIDPEAAAKAKAREERGSKRKSTRRGKGSKSVYRSRGRSKSIYRR